MGKKYIYWIEPHVSVRLSDQIRCLGKDIYLIKYDSWRASRRGYLQIQLRQENFNWLDSIVSPLSYIIALEMSSWTCTPTIQLRIVIFLLQYSWTCMPWTSTSHIIHIRNVILNYIKDHARLDFFLAIKESRVIISFLRHCVHHLYLDHRGYLCTWRLDSSSSWDLP